MPPPTNAHTGAHQAFLSHCTTPPTHSAQAPGRINLIGEHTDYNGGLVLPTPINRHCVAVASLSSDTQSHLLAADLNESFSFDPSTDLSTLLDAPRGIPRGHWASYILGVLHGYRLAGFAIPPLNIAIASDIPIGAGLSSSAALEAVTANLIEAISNRTIPPIEKARLCRTAEHTFAGVPCGIMDQYAVILGKPGQALLIDCASESAKLIPLPPPDKATILIIDTTIRHKLAGSEYAQRRTVCDSAAAKLGLPNISRATLSQLDASTALNEEERRLARYILSENTRVALMATALHSGNLAAAGALMYESHQGLRHDYRVSCPELDTIVDTARTIPGVFGARMTGAGFGGCVIALVEPATTATVTEGISAAFLKAHGHPCCIFAATTA